MQTQYALFGKCRKTHRIEIKSQPRLLGLSPAYTVPFHKQRKRKGSFQEGSLCQDACRCSSLQGMPMCCAQIGHCMLSPLGRPSVFTFWRKAFHIFHGYIHNFCIIAFIWDSQFRKQLYHPT